MNRIMLRILCAFCLALLTATISQYHEARNIAILEMRKRSIGNSTAITTVNTVNETRDDFQQSFASNRIHIGDNHMDSSEELCPKESPLLQGNNFINFEGRSLWCVRH